MSYWIWRPDCGTNASFTKAYNLKGITLHYAYQNVEAFEYYMRALNICRNKQTYEWKKKRAQVYINIASVFWMSDANRTALGYLQQAEELLEDLRETAIELDVHWAKGLIYQNLEKPDSAVYFLEKAHEGHLGLGDSLRTAILRNQLGKSHNKQKDYTKALKYYREALDFLKRNDIVAHMPLSAAGLGKIYFQTDDLPLAYQYLHLSNSWAQQAGVSDMLKNNYELLAEISYRWNRPDSAYFYLKKYTEKKEQEIADQKEKTAGKLDLEHRLWEKENENQLLARENELIQSRNLLYLIVFISFVVMFALSGFFLYKLYQKNRQIQQQYQSLSTLNQRLDNRHRQLRYLLSEKKHLVSLLTHDLRTPMMLIRLILNKLMKLQPPASHGHYAQDLQNIRNAIGQIDQISQRIISAENMEKSPPIAEIKNISIDKLIVNLQAAFLPLAQQRHIKLEYSPAPALTAPADKFLLKLALGNLLSNAIKFSPEHSIIRIGCYPNPSETIISIQDEGPGLPPSAQKIIRQPSLPEFNLTENQTADMSGLGLTLTRRYIEAMNGQLRVKSEPGQGTTMMICFHRASRKSDKIADSLSERQ